MMVSTFEALQAICKRLNMEASFHDLNDFDRPQILRFTLFCCIWKNVAIYAHKCSSTAQKKGGGV